MRMIAAAAALATGVVAVPTQAGELWAAFQGCMTEALAAENMTAPLMKPQPAQGSVSVRCRDASASRLFEAMSAVGKSGSAAGVTTRTSEAVQCFRFAGPPVSNECMVTIAVGAAFLDGL